MSLTNIDHLNIFRQNSITFRARITHIFLIRFLTHMSLAYFDMHVWSSYLVLLHVNTRIYAAVRVVSCTNHRCYLRLALWMPATPTPTEVTSHLQLVQVCGSSSFTKISHMFHLYTGGGGGGRERKREREAYIHIHTCLHNSWVNERMCACMYLWYVAQLCCKVAGQGEVLEKEVLAGMYSCPMAI